MSTTTTPTVRNGVPVDKLFGTIARIKEQPELGAFRWTARNRWVQGTASTSVIHDWYGAGADHEHVARFEFGADHPTLGHGNGPTPQEYALHALAGCIAAGIATTAAARRVELESVELTVRATQDVRGALAIDTDVRNGYGQVQVDVEIAGDATDEELRALVEASRDRSAIYDALTNETPVSVSVRT